MRKFFTILAIVLFAATVWAQSPQKMSYQAVVRNSSDQLMKNQVVGMQISILQGSEEGTAVYVETQTTTTNANGLVSIEIGGGTPVTSTFDGIDWSTGPYFIKTETDPTGGTSYNITGTSQLLSVPYALFAKRSGEHYVGELYGGGVVFWVDQTGNHGLICSMVDNSTGIIWTKDAYQSTTVPAPGALSDWNGQSNTTAIVSQAGAGSTYAAGLCDAYTNADYGTGVYSDWYLPSRGELNDLWNNLKAVQKALDSDGNVVTTAIIKDSYWSSSEIKNSEAFTFNFETGYSSEKMFNSSKYITYYVRAVRAF